MSNGRRLVSDVVELANQMPLAAFTGDFDAGLVAKFRRLTRPKVSWNVLYMKAYAAVSQRNPELRRSFVAFPFRHFYEHDRVVCLMTIAREYRGEERLFFARFNRPDEKSLADLQRRYDYYRQAPIEDVKQFRHQIMFASMPKPVRRLGWWVMNSLWPQKRASHMGTFGISFSGYKGLYGTKHLGTNSTVLGVDPLPRKGVSRILLTFDHRVLDGTPVTRMMQELQHILTTAIRVELAEMIGVDPKTGDKLSDQELSALKRRLEARKRKLRSQQAA